MQFVTLLIVVLAVSACTTVPEQIQGTFPEVSPARVDQNVFGSNVRWGGVIVDSRNENGRTCFEVLSRDLDKFLRPEVEDETAGRFIACKDGFHDPVVFTNGREVTITGQIERIEIRKLDDFDYRYPVVDVDHLVLWEKRRTVVVYRGFHHPWHWYHPWAYWGWGHPWWGPYPMHPSSGFVEPRTLLPDPSIIESAETVQHQ